ncbi:MAG: OmpA family protein, partial [Shewanella sp.]|nr:OmpA family protein [Shewanella sp.]
MRILILLLSITLVGACSMRDTVPMNGSTIQNHDLNDQDKDGVIVARERCMDTVKGAEVDNYGCGTVKTINERKELKIQFANDSSYLAPKYFGQLEELSIFMNKYPSTKVTIEGHCSKTGSYEHNLALSQNRAEAVTTVLSQKFSIDPSRLTAIG